MNTPIGDLHDKFTATRPSQAKQADIAHRQHLAIKSYNFGHDAGYARGRNDQRKLYRLMDNEEAGATPGNVKLWQCSSAVLTGILIGMLFALFTKGL